MKGEVSIEEEKWTASIRRDDRVRRWNSTQHYMKTSRRNRYQPSFEELERDAYDYTSTDYYHGPAVYRDPPSSQHFQHPLLTSSYSSVGYVERDYPQSYNSKNNHHRPPLPTPPGPFRPHHQTSSPVEHFPQKFPQRCNSIPVEPCFTRESSIRQGPDHFFQYPQNPLSPCHHPDFYDDVRRDRLPDDNDDIPMTRVTRLKEPGRTFWRDDGMKTDVGIGLGRISGMAASRRVSLRGGTKSDVGGVTHNTPIGSNPPNKVEEIKVSPHQVY